MKINIYVIFIILGLILSFVFHSILKETNTVQHYEGNYYAENMYEHSKKILRRFCSNEQLSQLEDLRKDYIASYRVFPKSQDGKDINFKYIKKGLEQFSQKDVWHQKSIKQLEIADFTLELDQLASLEQHFVNAIREKISLKKFYQELSLYLNDRDYLLFYKKDYDFYKAKSSILNPKNKEKLSFIKKVIQDEVNLDIVRANKIRGVLTRLYQEFKTKEKLSFQDKRDLFYIAKSLKYFYLQDKSQVLIAYRLWWEKSQDRKYFLEKLLNKKTSAIRQAINFLQNYELLAKAVTKLKADFYLYWLEQDEFERKLYLIGEIIRNEVGPYDSGFDMESHSVGQVFINRSKLKEFSTLDKNSYLYKELTSRGKTDDWIQSHKYLNTFFKSGEFSFTYFFKKSSVNSICKDPVQMLLEGDRHIDIALSVLEKPLKAFKATHYFSRHVIFGRLNINKIWKLKPAKITYGQAIDLNWIYHDLLEKNKYLVLYETQYKNKSYMGVRLLNLNFVYNKEEDEFYHYRNPDHFQYFVGVKNE